MSVWLAEKTTPLGEILFRLGDLRPELHFMREALVRAHLKQHIDDREESLGTLSTTALARVLLAKFDDPGVQTSLNPSPRDADLTAPGTTGRCGPSPYKNTGYGEQGAITPETPEERLLLRRAHLPTIPRPGSLDHLLPTLTGLPV
jgi:hypothetical protein